MCSLACRRTSLDGKRHVSIQTVKGPLCDPWGVREGGKVLAPTAPWTKAGWHRTKSAQGWRNHPAKRNCPVHCRVNLGVPTRHPDSHAVASTDQSESQPFVELNGWRPATCVREHKLDQALESRGQAATMFCGFCPACPHGLTWATHKFSTSHRGLSPLRKWLKSGFKVA